MLYSVRVVSVRLSRQGLSHPSLLSLLSADPVKGVGTLERLKSLLVGSSSSTDNDNAGRNTQVDPIPIHPAKGLTVNALCLPVYSPSVYFSLCKPPMYPRQCIYTPFSPQLYALAKPSCALPPFHVPVYTPLLPMHTHSSLHPSCLPPSSLHPSLRPSVAPQIPAPHAPPAGAPSPRRRAAVSRPAGRVWPVADGGQRLPRDGARRRQRLHATTGQLRRPRRRPRTAEQIPAAAGGHAAPQRARPQGGACPQGGAGDAGGAAPRVHRAGDDGLARRPQGVTHAVSGQPRPVTLPLVTAGNLAAGNSR